MIGALMWQKGLVFTAPVPITH